MALPPLPELTVFMALVLVLSLYALTVSGHFPAEHRAPSLTTPVGKLLLWGTLGLCAVLVLLLIQFAWRHVPLYAAVIGGGAMLLAAPLLLHPLPDSFVNGRLGLLVFAGLALCLVLIAETLVA
jgi:asparagine N-glycosylation enzyme membrane subunit Stt3